MFRSKVLKTIIQGVIEEPSRDDSREVLRDRNNDG